MRWSSQGYRVIGEHTVQNEGWKRQAEKGKWLRVFGAYISALYLLTRTLTWTLLFIVPVYKMKVTPPSRILWSTSRAEHQSQLQERSRMQWPAPHPTRYHSTWGWWSQKRRRSPVSGLPPSTHCPFTALGRLCQWKYKNALDEERRLLHILTPPGLGYGNLEFTITMTVGLKVFTTMQSMKRGLKVKVLCK